VATRLPDFPVNRIMNADTKAPFIETTALRETFYNVNSIRLHVVESGPEDGPPLIFLHGFPEFWYGWRKQIGYFARQGYRVLVPDQRGYNTSSQPGSIRDYRVEVLVQDIVELIGATGREKVWLVGHDWGAIVAWHLAIKHPELLQRLVIINVPHPAVMRRTLRKSLDQLRRSWYVFFIQIPVLPETLASLGNFRPIRETLRRSSLPGTFSAGELHEYRQSWRRSFPSMLNWYRAFRYPPEAHKNARWIQTPTLILWGTQDIALRKEMAAESLCYCRNGRLHRFEDATHWVHLEKSEEVNRLIGDFFEEDVSA
jgi:epoxide hydrolase 4